MAVCAPGGSPRLVREFFGDRGLARDAKSEFEFLQKMGNERVAFISLPRVRFSPVSRAEIVFVAIAFP